MPEEDKKVTTVEGVSELVEEDKPKPEKSIIDNVDKLVSIFVNAVRRLMRPYIGVLLVTACAKLVFEGKIPPEAFWGAAGLIIGFYFGERSQKKKTNEE